LTSVPIPVISVLTEITGRSDAVPKLSATATKFIQHWGELGNRWGINRTVAQIHALLYLSPEPLDAAAISDALSIARSNTSSSIRELVGWGIVRTVHVLGDRREHFEAEKDCWEMLTILVDARKRREVDPALAMLRDCANELREGNADERFVKTRITAMLSLFESMDALLSEFLRLPKGVVKHVVGLQGRLHTLLRVSR
jgi:DNA-binding transcriptional regulator GbsR (MarR family)